MKQMDKPLTLLLALTFLFLFSCSEQKPKPKIEYIENPKVKESLENHVISVIKSFDIKKMEEWGFGPKYDDDLRELDDEFEIMSDVQTQQTKSEFKSGYMWGFVMLMGSWKLYDDFIPQLINLEFVKFSHDESWKLVTYDGQIENYTIPDENKRILPPEVQTYIKSKFKTIDNLKRLQY